MDIPSLATGLSNASLGTAIGTAVAKKSLDVQKQLGEALVDAIAKAGVPDSLTRAGGGLDVTA